MTSCFKIYYIALPDHNAPVILIPNVVEMFHPIKDCHWFWGKKYCLVASELSLDISDACPSDDAMQSKPDKLCARPLDNHFIYDIENDFLNAAADANGSDNRSIYAEYSRLASRYGLHEALWNRCQSYKIVRQAFLKAIKEGLIKAEKKFDAVSEDSDPSLTFQALRTDLNSICEHVEHLYHENPAILRRSMFRYPHAIAAQMGQLDLIMKLLPKATQTMDPYYLLALFDKLSSLRTALQEQIESLSNPLHIDEELSETSTVVDDEYQTPPSSLMKYRIFFLCSLMLYSLVENQNINSRSQNLEEILSWEEEDWIEEVKYCNTLDTLDTLSISSHCQNLLLFRYCDFSATDINEQYKDLILRIESMPETDEITDQGGGKFNAVQKLIILGAGLRLYTAAPREIERLRPQICVDDMVSRAQASPLYRDVEKKVIERHLENALGLLEPPVKIRPKMPNIPANPSMLKNDDFISRRTKRPASRQDDGKRKKSKGIK